MKKYFKFITLLALIAPTTTACSNNSTSSSNSTVKNSTESKRKSSSISSSNNSQSSSNKESSNSTSNSQSVDKNNSKMNLEEIKNGNYSSLKGNWELIKAIGHNQDITDSTNDTLNVQNTVLSSSSMSISSQGLNDISQHKTYPVQFKNNDDSLTATLTNEAATKASINWSISFYPAGSQDFTVNGEKQDPPTRNTIVIWTSNNNFSEVFQER